MNPEVCEEFRKVNEKLDKILELLIDTRLKTEKMESHIDFVEATYSSVRSPLQYIKNRFEIFSGNGQPELPRLN